jgi:hypothetical protein
VLDSVGTDVHSALVPPGALHQQVTAALSNWQLDDAEELLADVGSDPSPYVAPAPRAGDAETPADLGRAWADTLRAELLVRRLRKAGFTLVGDPVEPPHGTGSPPALDLHAGVAELPVAEMAGDEDAPLARRQRGFDQLEAIGALEHVEDVLLALPCHQGRLDHRPSEMLVRAARDALHLVARQLRKGGRHLSLDHTAPDAQRPISERADVLAEGSRATERQPMQRAHDAAQGVVLGAMREAHAYRQRRRSRAALAARSKASIMAESVNSRATRPRPAFPIARRCSSRARNWVTSAAVVGASRCGRRVPAIPSAT